MARRDHSQLGGLDRLCAGDIQDSDSQDAHIYTLICTHIYIGNNK